MESLARDSLGDIRSHIETFIAADSANHPAEMGGGPIFDAPLVGIADGDDPLFAQYKSLIGAFHLTPQETIALAASQTPNAKHASLDKLSVIAWALPITETTRQSNRRQRRVPSRLWAQTRDYGEKCNDALRHHVVDLLRQAGYLAIAPALPGLVKVYRDEGTRPPASTWSERHILYAAGLGTFSLSDGFITPRGIAMRCGSVVTNLPIPATPRVYENHTANCSYLAEGACGKCIMRCPAGAISAWGHDKAKCGAYLDSLDELKSRYGVSITGCGLCQTAVPCEARIPPRIRNR
jgi:epoxyqueuosine reductase QueG